jgi:hypothetical protein
MKSTSNSNTVGLSKKALEIVRNVDKNRKEKGLSSSISAVASEAVVKVFGNA